MENNLKKWKITAIVSLCLLVLVSCLYVTTLTKSNNNNNVAPVEENTNSEVEIEKGFAIII